MTTMIQEPYVVPGRTAASYLPLAVRAAGLPCLVVGGGRIGSRKAASLVAAGAKVAVLSPAISPSLTELVRREHVEWLHAEYDVSYVNGYRLVVAATNNADLNLQIGQDAEDRGILSCVTSSAGSSRTIFPAVWSDGDITVAVHSDGRSCRRSQTVRNRIAGWLSALGGSSDARTDRRDIFLRAAECPRAHRTPQGTPQCIGKVYIVGAGPGAADLISLRGYRAMQFADAFLVDRLVPATFLDDLGISTAGKLVCHLGDEQPRWTQEEINRWLVATAQTGRTVVRLKGGDPLIFGRGDAEVNDLAASGIPWEVIPGPSSATAVATAAGLPLTRHGNGRSFAVTTARVEGGKIAASFPRVDSLVILMGIAVLDEIAARLVADGWPPDVPAAIVERGTLTWERHVVGPLCRLSELARRAGVASPALIVVGDAARSIAAVRDRPTLLFTGLDPSGFRSLGTVLHWPAQAIVRPPNVRGQLARAIASLRRRDFDWVLLTDKVSVDALGTELTSRRLDARSLRGVQIAVVGTETARRLERYCLYADVVVRGNDVRRPLLLLGELSHRKILLAQGTHAPRGFRRRLKAAGAMVTHLVLRHLVPHPELGRPLPSHDVVYFVSPTGVRAYAAAYGSDAFRQQVWCLGEATRTELAKHGVAAVVVSPWQPLAPRSNHDRSRCEDDYVAR